MAHTAYSQYASFERQFAVADQFYKLHTNPYADEATKAGPLKRARLLLLCVLHISIDKYNSIVLLYRELNPNAKERSLAHTTEIL